MSALIGDVLGMARRRRATGIRLLDGRKEQQVKWADLIHESGQLADRAGIPPGSRIGIVGETNLEFVRKVLATWSAGGCVVLLPGRPRGMASGEFDKRTAARLTAVAAHGIWSAGYTVDLRHKGPRLSSWDDQRERGGVLIQFSSGTSSIGPSPIVVSSEVLVAHVESLVDSLPLSERDTVVTWMPVYHDMCFIGFFLTALFAGAEIVLRPPGQFVARPSVWLDDLSRYGGTVTGGPSTALGIVARALGLKPPDLADGLTSVSSLIVGSEVLRPVDIAAFEECVATFGMSPGALRGAYGMAEAVVGVSLGAEGAGISVCPLSGGGDICAGIAEGVGLSGQPLTGIEVAIAPLASESQPDEVGEVLIRGPNIVGRPGRFDDEGWYQTGDVGWVVDSQLAVAGRRDDLIVIGGRKFSPQVIEAAAERVDGVRAGSVAAVHAPGEGVGEPGEIVVVIESRSTASRAICERVIERIYAVIGMVPVRTICVPRRTLPKTTSGKIRRGAIRAEWRQYDQLDSAERGVRSPRSTAKA